MSKPMIYVTRLIPQPALDRLEEVFNVEVNPASSSVSRERLLEKVRDADALLCLLTESIDREVLDAAPRLKCVSNYAVGYNNIDVEYATQKGIAVCNTPGVLTETTADLAWALIMACGRHIVPADVYTRSGKFTVWQPLLFLGNDIHGKTLGIVGMGRIGSAVARRAKGFDMKVLWFDPQAYPGSIPTEYERTDLPDLCQRSDYISIHAPLTPETEHLIGPGEFGQMKPSAILVNTARGPIVDEAALIEALQNKRITAAGLDVYEHEPRIPDALKELDNVVLLPHIGSASIETRTAMGLLAAENAIAVIEGRVPPARVN